MSEYVAHFQAAQDAFHINRLMLSRAFAEAFQKLLGKLGDVGSDPNQVPPEAAEKAWIIMKTDSAALIALALREIDEGVGLSDK
ncbi:MAG: hypothetical protein V4808_15025 [Pseudomonadota bacterium]